MTPQELKNSILQLAIQGKLVEQRPEEGTAAELLEKILAAKNAEGAKGKGEKSHAKSAKSAKVGSCVSCEEIPDDEKPFDIPESWEWVRFGVLGQLLDGEKRAGEANPCLDAKFLRGKCEAKYLTSGKFVSKGDKVILVDGENSGEVFVVPQDGYMGSTFKVLSCSPLLFEPYILSFLSYHKKDYRNNKKGAAIPHLNKDLFFNMPLPLPPLAEQKRIVAKIEELMPLVDRYEKAWSRLEDFNKRFPVDMQKSLLQMAIQGKLVEQRAEEGSGRELLGKILAAKNAENAKGKGEKSHVKSAKFAKVGSSVSREEIPDDEKPFDIPESWEWVRVGDVCTNIQYGSSKKSASTGSVPVLRMGNIQNGKIDYSKLVFTSDEDEIRKYALEGDDLLFNRTNSKELVGKVAIYKGEQPAIYAGYLVRITPVNISADYLNYVMQSQYYWEYCQSVRSDAIGQSNINAEKLKRFVFPLPPLAEQKRIVAKLEELLLLCERLK